MHEGGKNAPDIEAQRDFMDMVCRSYAARLERRRNLVITSVRFHRLAEEVTMTTRFVIARALLPFNLIFECEVRLDV